jgi:hypothetical protein
VTRTLLQGYPHSFIEKHWDAMYYGLRCPAPVNISPFFALEDDKDAAKMTQTARAAAFVSGFTKWTRMVLAGDLSQDKDMCSNTFPKHFSSAKVRTHRTSTAPSVRLAVLLCWKEAGGLVLTRKWKTGGGGGAMMADS